MKYATVHGTRTSQEDFEESVNNLIAEGWIPKGGVSLDGWRLVQAMILKEPKDD